MSRGRAAFQLATFAVVLAVSSDAASQAPVRDAAKSAAAGTASIGGTIVTDDSDARPLRRVRVAAATADRQVTRSAVTDDSGRFVMTGLPAGRYLLTAAKPGYASYSYGATRPNRPGTAVVLGEGQRLTGLTLRMARGAVISGQLVDQNGDPFAGAQVYAMRNVFVGTGQRQLVPAGSSLTDDRGHYRIWGLAAGDYVISANAGFGAAAMRPDMEIARLTDADIARAVSDLGRGTARPGGPAGAGGAPPDAAAPPPRTVGYASVFYPGTFVASQATAIKVGAGEERAGVDFPLSLVPTAKVEGTIAVPEGVSAQGLSVQMIGNNPAGMLLDVLRRANPTADGSFTFAGVAPGTYTIVVRGQPPRPAPAAPAARPGPPQQPTHWATAEVTVDGQDISGLSLMLQPGMTVKGRVQFEGTTTLPDATRFRITFAPVQNQGEVTVGVSGTQPDASGAFSMVGVTPGRYRINAVVASVRPDTTWRVKSAVVDGRDALDFPIELRSQPGEVVVTFSDQSTELSGIVQDAAGQPAPEYHVVIFAADRNYWTAPSRRIRSLRPSADGKYTVSGLPPGEYLMVAVSDIEPGEWFDPALLDQLSRVALKVTLADGEKKAQDLRPAARFP
jgi:Carboxypeptidase regulatory-like domain